MIPLFLAVIFISCLPVYGYSIYLQPQGVQLINPGDDVTVEVYLRGEGSRALQVYGWGFNLGYDQTELAYQSYTLGPANFNAAANDESVGLLAAGSNKYKDEAIKKDLLHVGWYDLSFAGFIEVPAASDTLLFSANFRFLGGLADGEDIWVEWWPDTISGQLVPNASYLDTNLGFFAPDALGMPVWENYAEQH
jgi:hypothetical protein